MTLSVFKPSRSTTFILSGQNLFSCVGGVSVPPVNGLGSANQATYKRGQDCGFGLRHLELLDMPAIGAMVFFGVRREWR
jgi:hypothetical protein